jgi:hypothetical protein
LYADLPSASTNAPDDETRSEERAENRGDRATVGGRVPRRIVGIVAFGACAVAGLFAWAARSSGVEQPVPYNHKVHLDAGMDCAACHTGAREGTHAGIPTTDQCALCHRADREYPCTPDALARYLKAGEEIPWHQLHRAPRHVWFSHQRHVTAAGLDCAECHGDVKQKTEPFTRAAFPSRQPGMDRCIACHRKERVTTDCTACHR